MRNLILRSRFAAIIALWCGCSATEDLGSRSNAISQEQPYGVAMVVTRFYFDPVLSSLSFANPQWNSTGGACSSTMIGPNLLLSAAHCGGPEGTANFYTYQNGDYTQPVIEVFNCHVLLNTFAKSDLVLAFCDPNLSGESPGDKYGYLDLQPSAPYQGETVISYWHNPIDSLGLNSAEILSVGSVTATNTTIWPSNSSDLGPINQAKGISFDLWTNGGASGSSMIDLASHRIVAAPTSTGAADARGRNALSIKTEMEEAAVNGWYDGNSSSWQTGVNNAEIQSLGLNPTRYSGKVDKDGDYRFDIQTDLERLRGENLRIVFELGFASPRKNTLWDSDPYFTSFTSDGTAIINVITPSLLGDRDFLVHRRAPLVPYQRYQAHFKSKMSDWGTKFVVRGRNGLVQTSYAIGYSPDWFDNVVEFVPTTSTVEIAITGANAMSGGLRDFFIVAEERFLGFDTADERHLFQDPDANGGPARFSIDGKPTPFGAPSFAADVDAFPSMSTGSNHYTVATDKLALRAGTQYQVCFAVRLSRTGTNPADSATMEIRGVANHLTGMLFQPTAAWTTLCTPSFHAESETHLQFGVTGPGAPSYFVDDVVAFRQACGTANPEGCPSYDQCVNGSCVCTPTADPCATQTANPLTCGLVSNGCGGTVSCGTCHFGTVCESNQCTRLSCRPPACLPE